VGESLFDTNWLIHLYNEGKKEEQGTTTIFNIIEYPKALDYFTKINITFPTSKDYESSLYLSKELFKLGKPIPSSDILIASICYNQKLTLVSLDKHFNVIKEVWDDFQLKKE